MTTMTNTTIDQTQYTVRTRSSRWLTPRAYDRARMNSRARRRTRRCEHSLTEARASVTTARAAAAHVRALGQLLVLGDLEGVAATAGRDGVRVVDLEARLLDRVQEV